VDDTLEKIPKNLWAVKRLKDCDFWFLKAGEYIGNVS
jgi:hypothetical protein